MNKKNTIDLVFIKEEIEPELDNNMFPIEISGNIHKFEKETIINSLNNLIADVSEILDKVKSNTNDRIELEQLSIAAQINAQGGITWIANVNTGITNSMVLTFKIKKSK